MHHYNGIPVMLFEDNIPEYIQCDTHSKLSLSQKYIKYGYRSLKWCFNEGSEIIFNSNIGYKPFDGNDRDQKRDSFAIWIYNEKPVKDHLTFQFGRKEEDVSDCWFEFGLNFRGWRSCWVMYDRDMKGHPNEQMDRLIIKAPVSVESHTIYINKIVLSVPIDARHHSRDYQVPYVNKEADKKANSHWMSLYAFSRVIESANLDSGCTESDIIEFNLISNRFREFILNKAEATGHDIINLRDEYESYYIELEDGNKRWKTVDFIRYYELFDHFNTEKYAKLFNSIKVKDYVSLMYRIAENHYRSSNIQDSNELEEMFIALLDNMYEQGFAEGSGLGTVHHLGYAFRDYYKAIFLMRDIVKKSGRLERTQKSMSWFSGMGRIFYENCEAEGSNMDVLNTLIQGMLTSILVMDNDGRKVALMKQFSRWLAFSISPKPGLKGPFKIDGSGYHHCNLYPAYTLGGLQGSTPVIYFLSGTGFRLSEKEHELMKKVVLNLRLYSNKYEWLVSLSSRHPKGSGQHCSFDVLPFKFLALAGAPDGSQKVDQEMASAYLRLVNDIEDETALYFREMDIIAEDDLSGHWTLNYGALAIHRRGNWLVGARGHSRYIWANESYKNANLFGRYITHGHIQIMGSGEPVNNRDSGYVQEGWDWNSWPGTTTVHLPVEQLKSDVKNVDTFSGFEEMLLSDETYAGGLNLQNENGMFAMKLHEHPKYEGSHRARKSAFFFNNRVICLGSNIENTNAHYSTRTTLFQNHLTNKDEPLYINSCEEITGLHYKNTLDIKNPIWMMDNKGNGYYLPANQKVTVKRSLQYSKAQNTGEDKEGTFAKAYLEHGKAPKTGQYEYMILVKVSLEDAKNLEEAMRSKATQIYTVLQKDYHAHIVKDHETSITGYALFEPCEAINKELVVSVDTPCMLMTREMEEEVILSLCDPDLRLYEGIDESQYDIDGNRKEVSIYSRTWKNNPSKVHTLTIKVKGSLDLVEKQENCRVIKKDKNMTTLEFDCKDAIPIEVRLKKDKNN